ncbi:MAG: bifunctional phosphopantothenoylcysteine decarboxylase/phosphopantothenate--cysteine ligase CoaBC [Xanthomonadales bacterium]|nr:bifunctional phosphopantothenoylcysteine decarboxylase/phosphopantothenate--cysteine ligase CoaBC [Xanthomonadales bacterium]
MSLPGRRILLCVCGGIAAYKAVELVRRLREAGAEVQVAMTENAQRFVGAASLQAVSGVPVRGTLWDEAAEAAMGHIELARWADRVVVAPATADVLAKLAHGLADDLVSTLCLATTAPIAVAPAMNNRMWLHPATQANVATLRGRGVQVIGPDDGAQACGEFGPGRLREPPDIVAALAEADAAVQDLAGVRLLISAGPTFEDLDPVRFIGNRSSGKMGFAIAAAAARRGADVTLIAGPVSLCAPAGVRRVDVRSAAQMRDAVLGALPADVYIGAAAIADYTPRIVSPQKIKKTAQSGDGLTVELVRTPDVLAEVAAHAQRPRVVVGFAAETNDVEHYARDKLVRKRLDMIAANQVGRAGCGFESDDNALTVIDAETSHALGPGPKTVLADALLDLVKARLG